MRITYTSDASTNVSIIDAIPGDLDGFPAISRLAFPTPSIGVSPDRLAVAGALAFGKYISGQVTFDERFSSLTAQVMQRFFSPRWVHVTPLHPANVPIPRGSSTARFGTALEGVAAGNNLLITAGRPSQGVSYIENVVSIPTNAFLLDAVDNGKSWHSFGARLAIAILYSEELDIAILQSSEWEGIEDTEFLALRELLSACGLGLSR